jgi:DNA mismatch repair ATPase MutS
VGFLDRHPVFKKAIANQYQAILAAGAVAFATVLATPVPLILFLGVELMAMPFLVDRLRRRMEIEKKFADREAHSLSQEEQFDALGPASRQRFVAMRKVLERVQANYKGLTPASQGILAEQSEKFERILGSALRRLWLLERYAETERAADPKTLEREIARLTQQLGSPELAPRIREALEKNREIQQELLKTLHDNQANREGLEAELESLESLLQLLLQKSISATDASAFTTEIDDVLAQVDSDAASVEEMERMLASFPASESESGLSPRLRPMAEVPPPPPPRARERR